MKNIVIFSVLLVSIFYAGVVNAQDDVYDAPKSKKVKVKQTQTAPSEQTEKIIPVEKSQPYTEDDNSTSRMPSGDYTTNNASTNQFDNNQDDYSADFGFGYSDRIRRFHNPSLQFNYGWNNWNNGFNDPWFNNGWNNWDNFSFNPSCRFGYNNFYNPFWNNAQIIIIQPGFNSWYNTGFYNPWNSFSNWNNYGGNLWNNGWYGFSPYCSNAIFNNGFSNFNGYYDNNRKNVIYTPRTGGYNNTNNMTRGNNSNYNYNNPSNTSTKGGLINGNNNQQAAPAKKWNNNASNKSNPNPQNNDVYRYNNKPANNNWNNSSSPAPSNNNNNSNNGNSGVKIGTRPK